MTTQPKHTPTPWRAELSTIYGPLIEPLNPDGPDDPICSVINKPDAAYIVRCVNAHEAMLEALKATRDWLNDKATIERDEYKANGYAHHVLRLSEAIAKASGNIQ